MTEVKRLPVFVFPSSLNFFADESSSHKQMVTVYNPYDFVVNFKVLCNAPHKYQIGDPEGSIKPHCCMDIVIRHISILPTCYHVTDKFRIQMNEHNSRQLLGKKDIPVILLPGKSTGISDSTATSLDNFRQFSTDVPSASSSDSSSSTMQIQASSNSLGKLGYQNAGPNYIAIVVAVVCIIALMLPSNEAEGGSSSSVWSMFHLSSQQKLVFAYSLGLVTMVIFRV
ncbi:motile sperm domain-containing protein 1-like [Daphnia pulex]|uniref:motile sperm domain-containing protein 1-like n=1 Tax=Daphnia pulex TaxID=6669 RepID=UPI001EE0053A|nr:motile sperm domain-containing protein 1-like [Daphnia pulex]